MVRIAKKMDKMVQKKNAVSAAGGRAGREAGLGRGVPGSPPAWSRPRGTGSRRAGGRVSRPRAPGPAAAGVGLPSFEAPVLPAGRAR